MDWGLNSCIVGQTAVIVFGCHKVECQESYTCVENQVVPWRAIRIQHVSNLLAIHFCILLAFHTRILSLGGRAS